MAKGTKNLVYRGWPALIWYSVLIWYSPLTRHQSSGDWGVEKYLVSFGSKTTHE